MIPEEDPTLPGRRRARGARASARSEALERLKALRGGGGGGSHIKMEQPIYDVVDEDEYKALVAKRRGEAEGFIVDDNGLGYGDEGQEEDWCVTGVASSSEDSEGESERSKKKKKVLNSEKEAAKKPSPLASAAALMGKQRISNMFTSSVFKKGMHKKDSLDSIVDDVIAEFAPDENDRERRRRVNSSNLGLNKSNNLGGLPVRIKKPIASSYTDSIKNDFHETNSGGGDEDFDHSGKLNSIIDEDNSTIDAKKGLDTADMMRNELGMEMRTATVENKKDELLVGSECEGKKVETEVYSLNTKLEEAKDPALSASVGWQAVSAGVVDCKGTGTGLKGFQATSIHEKLDFEVESSGSLPFYILDAHANSGIVYLFGKVKSRGTYHSCCAVLRNVQRCVYAVPTVSFTHNDSVFELEDRVVESRKSLMASKKRMSKHERDCEELAMLEKDLEESQAALRAQLHELASELKAEIVKELLQRNVSTFSMVVVKRNYAFERTDIPHGENYALKINYPFEDTPLPSDLKGNNFRALLGTHNSELEMFLIKRKIKGPSWLSISKFSSCTDSERVSWCKFEVIIDSPKDIQVSTSSENISEIPPLAVTSINLKTIINEKQNTNEIVSAHVICCHRAKIDTPTDTSDWKWTHCPGILSHFTVVRKLEGGIFPMGFTTEAADRNTKAGSNVICYESSERALLNRLMIELHKLDSDVLVGHNISGFDLDILLHRVQACKVPSNMWSKIGRLKRSIMPKLQKKRSSVFGSGASQRIMSCVAGRLLCDTYICSQDLLKEVSYSLSQLAKSQLEPKDYEDHKEINPHDIPKLFETSGSLMELIKYGKTEALLSMKLMFRLSVLPLTRELTNISGNLWHKTLQGARAQRVEYLLLHAFHAKKFIVPDKFSPQSKDTRTIKRKTSAGIESTENDPDVTNFDEAPEVSHGKTNKGPSYSGGLVLEPKKGLYDKYILLLDFNSLYPSIIQEYNICFTTVERSPDGMPPRPPSSKKIGVLPELLRNLVNRRKGVISLLKTKTGLKVEQLHILQQALKLTANSMYGCLGFSNSRFYAKHLAELTTLQGREILQSTVDLVQNTLNLEVIYGDTDSVMIYSGLDDIGKANLMATKVIQEVNKKYGCIKIALDGLYKRMLLLKKKKYAAVKMEGGNEVIVRKGLDMVRRDWSLLSKELGNFCLNQILSGRSCDDVVEVIHNSLMKVQEEMRNGQIPLEKYEISKRLTKEPEEYPDSKSQPHVEVALRLKRNGVSGCSAGDTVHYVICCEQGTGSTSSVGIAQRARHLDELEKDNGNWIIDIDYYLAQQIHPVISRLCASIQGTSPARLADCLGLDSSKNRLIDFSSKDPSSLLSFVLDDEERFRGCEPLVLSCPSCSATFGCSPIFTSVCTYINTKPEDVQAGSDNFWHKLCCPRCPEGDVGKITPAAIANQVKRQAERFVSIYYKGLMMCDDETCNYTTRGVNLRAMGDSERGTTCPNYPRCNGHLIRKYTEADLYRQLTYFCYTLDTVRCISKMEADKRFAMEKELARLRPLVEMAASTVEKMRDRCAYGWVQLKDFAVLV
ncbi:DNA-directed DNA polymerase [Salvia divinorum]|uniref:DNA polymerase n=1 Tax=Salvia divinorum TaxID=28513 RepID=A0ABD1HY14_SALDI